MQPQVLCAHSLMRDRVYNTDDKHIGELKELMIDLDTGRVAYAVVTFGGFMGIGDKYFAMPWQMLRIDTDERRIVIDVSEETLETAPGFDKDDWPERPEFWQSVDTHWEAFIVTTV